MKGQVEQAVDEDNKERQTPFESGWLRGFDMLRALCGSQLSLTLTRARVSLCETRLIDLSRIPANDSDEAHFLETHLKEPTSFNSYLSFHILSRAIRILSSHLPGVPPSCLVEQLVMLMPGPSWSQLLRLINCSKHCST